MIYIANYVTDEVFVVHHNTGKLVTTLHVGRNPRTFLKGHDPSVLYVINDGSYEISIINTVDQTVANRIQLPKQPDLAWFGENDNLLYVTCANNEVVWAVDTDTLKVTSVSEKEWLEPKQENMDLNFVFVPDIHYKVSDTLLAEGSFDNKKLDTGAPVNVQTNTKLRFSGEPLPLNTPMFQETVPNIPLPEQEIKPLQFPPVDNKDFLTDSKQGLPTLIPNHLLTSPMPLDQPSLTQLTTAIPTNTITQVKIRSKKGIAYLHDKIERLGLSAKVASSLHHCLRSSSKELRSFIRTIQRLAQIKLISDRQASSIIRCAKKLL